MLGLPLLLALFQFVNDHEYPEPEETVSKRTVLYGFVMVASALLLWRFYSSAFYIIQSELGVTPLTDLLFLFMLVMLAIIFVILLIQMEQMAGEEARYPLMAYLIAFSGIFVAQMQTSRTITLLVIVLAIVSACMGAIDHSLALRRHARELCSGGNVVNLPLKRARGWKGWNRCTSEPKLWLLGPRAAKRIRLQ